MQKIQSKNKISFEKILLGLVVLAIAIGLVLNYVSLNEISAELTGANKQYEKLVSEGESLEYEIKQKVNSTNIEQLAADLNMVKPESYQVRYFDIVEADSMSTTLADEKKSGLLDGIVYSFNILVEYLK